MLAALALPVNVAEQRPAPPVRIVQASASPDAAGVRLEVAYEQASARAVSRVWLGVVAVGADGRAIAEWELQAGPRSSWTLGPVLVIERVRCPSLSSYPWECAGATRTVDLRLEAVRLDVVVSRAWFADGLGVWMGPPEFDRFGPRQRFPVHVVVDNLP